MRIWKHLLAKPGKERSLALKKPGNGDLEALSNKAW